MIRRAACSACSACNARWRRHSLGQPSSRTLSALAADTPLALTYDRDTGIVWETAEDAPSRQARPLCQTVIGIEIHAQLAIPTKLFSSAPTRHHPQYSKYGGANASVHPYDIAYPGTLPSLSLSAVNAAILSATALNCNINERSRFERKHYFYPDLPAGYQITQQRWPLASDGVVAFLPHSSKQQPKKKGKKKRRRGDAQDDKGDGDAYAEFEPRPVQLRIDRIQLEQDTGKTTTHPTTDGNGQSLSTSHIDYNRAGCALIEIVSHPDLRSAHEAAGVVEKIRKLLKHVGSCDGRMEEGSLRCDVNVSVAPIDATIDIDALSEASREEMPPGNGQRVEVKNLNSLRQIVAATEYEALRQTALARDGSPTGRETRTFRVQPASENALGGETVCIRAKGDAVDYRFMPEPDLPPLMLDEDTLGSSLEDFIKHYLPESPEAAKARLVDEYGLNEDVGDVITGDPPAIALFEQAVATAQAEVPAEKSDEVATLAANWLCNDLFALVKKSATKGSGSSQTDEEESPLNHPISVECSPVEGNRLGMLVAMVANGLLSSSMAKKVLSLMFEEDHQSLPGEIAEANGWRVISDMDALVDLCEGVVLYPRNASQLEQYKLGGKKVWKIEKFYAGKVMAASKGNAHPEKMKEALARVLEREASNPD
ncbi:hypothetical protein ACHAXT_009073 [Thalassiosira profunda]